MANGLGKWAVGICCAVALACGATTSQAAVRNVCKSGCTYRAIQTAIDAAAAGDTVLVHDGLYAELIDFKGKAVAVRSVNGPAATTIDGSEKGRVVTFSSGEGSGSVLDGFTISGGDTDEPGGGAGIRCANASSPSISNCVVRGNYAAQGGGGISCLGGSAPVLTNLTLTDNDGQYGGGIYCEGSSPHISGCTIAGNIADYGGGISCVSAAPQISGCTISGNVVVFAGGGIHCSAASPAISDCAISGNHTDWSAIGSEQRGGGIACFAGSAPVISRCAISRNAVYYGGGGIFCRDSSPVIADCRVTGNEGGGHGGGIFCENSSPAVSNCVISGNEGGSGAGVKCSAGSAPVLVNCTISGNSSSDQGGGVACEAASPSLVNCTINGNSAANSGGGIFCSGTSNPTVVNGILWADAAAAGAEVNLIDTAAITIAFSDVQAGWTGVGNINADPLFLDPRPATEAPTAAGDYRLSAGSPCADVGTGDTATYPAIPAHDLAGDPRPQEVGQDMGSDEFALLANGSFEEVAERIPVPWAGTGLAAGDGRVLGGARGGRASFFLGGATATKELSQTRMLAGAAGDVLRVSGWSRTAAIPATGGLLGLTLTVYHTDGTTKLYTLGLPRGTHGWLRSKRNFPTVKSYKKVKVSLVLAGLAGRAWFDDVQLEIGP